MEGDCQTLINLVINSTSHCSVANLLTTIQFWAAKFYSIQYKFIKKEGNKIEHDLAKFCCISSCFYSNSGTHS
ncbi:putative ribonuclease H domain-containing protein [Arabidopsis thaliana]